MARARWRWWRYVALGLAGLVGLAGIVLLIWRAPTALYAYVPEPKDRAVAEASTRTGLIAGLAGLGALGSLAIATRTYWLTQQGQITDRYTKAIEQLGWDKLDVRLGGIYALERIAIDSERDHPTVVEVLSAFVREHSQEHALDALIEHNDPLEVARALLPRRSRSAERQSSPDSSSDSEPNGSTVSHMPAPPPVEPATDVQAAVSVLGRLPRRSGVSRGDLSRAFLTRAVLVGADLSGGRLDRANLSVAVLHYINLSQALLRRADLPHVQGYRADLSAAYLEGADLSGAILAEANLSYARLEGANLSEAFLDGADLSGARLDGADLSGARLERADLRKITDLTQEQLNSADGDANTRLPDGLQRPDHWGTRNTG